MVVSDLSNLASETYALAASSEPIAALVKEALEVIDDALDEYGYATRFPDPQPVIVISGIPPCIANYLPVSPDKVSLSFNGGKDCM
jgi:hypothetical protein